MLVDEVYQVAEFRQLVGLASDNTDFFELVVATSSEIPTLFGLLKRDVVAPIGCIF